MRASLFFSVMLLLGLRGSASQKLESAGEPTLHYWGVLKANPDHLASDLHAGINLVEVGVRWDRYEPQKGVFDDHYRAQIVDLIDQYRRAGVGISVATATQYTPQWIVRDKSQQAQSQFPDDYSGMANLFFDQAVRDEAEGFVTDVVKHVGPVNFFRIGLSHHGEMVLPVAERGQWWAMDPKAQGDIPGRPATLPEPPFRHWFPGQLLHGRTATPAEVKQWWNWYFSALIDAHDWEAAAIRRAGFTGYLQYVIPGPGVRPLDLDRAFHRGLPYDPSDRFHQVNVGAAWYLLLDRLKDRHAYVDISSVFDSSGQPRGNACESNDRNVDYLHDPVVLAWSSTRWLAFNARRNGFKTIGENPGEDSAATMALALTLAQSCQLEGLQWAFDDELYDGKYASISDYAALIRQMQRKRGGVDAH